MRSLQTAKCRARRDCDRGQMRADAITTRTTPSAGCAAMSADYNVRASSAAFWVRYRCRTAPNRAEQYHVPGLSSAAAGWTDRAVPWSDPSIRVVFVTDRERWKVVEEFSTSDPGQAPDSDPGGGAPPTGTSAKADFPRAGAPNTRGSRSSTCYALCRRRSGQW